MPAPNNAPPPPMVEDDEDMLSLGEIIATLLEYKWLMLIVTSVALMAGALNIYLATPIYQADATLQIEGGQKGLSALSDLQSSLASPFSDNNTLLNTQVQILKSRMILGQVVDKQKLDILASPRYLPVVGAGLARRYNGEGPAEPPFGLAEFAWGGESIKVESLDVPDLWLGETLTLVAGEQGSYQLLGPDKTPLFGPDKLTILQGRVGEQARDKGVSLFVSQLTARPGTHFRLTRLSQQQAISDLQDNLDVSLRKSSAVLDTVLVGPNITSLSEVLSEIVNAYVRQNVEYHSTQAENTLKFLESQLPTLKSQLDTATTAYNNYRQRQGSVDLNMETQGVLASVVDVEKDLAKLQVQRDELRQRFTAEHPSVQAVDAQMLRLKASQTKVNTQVGQLPNTQQTILRLKQDVDVNSKLYLELLNAAQQLRVSKAGTVGDARIVDAAVVSKQLAPKALRIFGISFVIGVLGSLAMVWLLRSLRVVVQMPESIEKGLGLPVYATVPHSKAEVALSRLVKSGKAKVGLLAISQPDDDAIESLRSLRTTLHFALLDADKSSVLITGPRPGLGKSFVSINLAVVLAQAGKRVVIVDADMRKGHIHRGFNLQREVGLSEFISGTAQLEDIVKTGPVPGLFVVTTGQRPPNPSELLMNHRFEELLEKLGASFDTVIVDAPPILAVSDAAIIGRLAGATLLVARAGLHPLRELEQAVSHLNKAGVEVKGFVFNDMDTTRQRYRYGYKGYVYKYAYKSA